MMLGKWLRQGKGWLVLGLALMACCYVLWPAMVFWGLIGLATKIGGDYMVLPLAFTCSIWLLTTIISIWNAKDFLDKFIVLGQIVVIRGFARFAYRVAVFLPLPVLHSDSPSPVFEPDVWAEEHCHGFWLRLGNEFFFASVRDATYFKLRWYSP